MEQVSEKTQARANLIVDTIDDILLYMEDHEITKASLAKTLKVSKSSISQMLNHHKARNMTMGTLSDICFSLGITPKIFIDGENVITNEKIHEAQNHITQKMQFLIFQVNDFKKNMEDMKKKETEKHHAWQSVTPLKLVANH